MDASAYCSGEGHGATTTPTSTTTQRRDPWRRLWPLYSMTLLPVVVVVGVVVVVEEGDERCMMRRDLDSILGL